MKKWLVLMTLVLGFSSNAWSHVRWFVVPDDRVPKVEFELDYISALIFLGVIIYGGLCVYLQRSHQRVNWLRFWWMAPIPFGDFKWKLLRAGISVLLVGNIILNVFIAPNLTSLELPMQWMLFIQAALLICLILGDAFFSVGLLLVLAGIVLVFPFDVWIDYGFEFLALVLVFAILSARYWLQYFRIDKSGWLIQESLDQLAVSIIRIGLGLQLIVLAVHNKLLDPTMALMFVESHDYLNFVQLLGISAFSHLHFVLAGGLAELCFGVLLVLNISSRFVALSVSFFFILSSLILGLHELVGHVPIIACLLVLIISPESVSWPSLKHLWKTLVTIELNSGRQKDREPLIN